MRPVISKPPQLAHPCAVRLDRARLCCSTVARAQAAATTAPATNRKLAEHKNVVPTFRKKSLKTLVANPELRNLG